MGGELRPGIVHRLDKMTSGLVVVAKNDVAHRRLSDQFKSREVHKTYVALVHGRMATDSGEISRPVGRDPRRRTRMKAGGIAPREALTKYRVLRRIGHFTLVEAMPQTGTHASDPRASGQPRPSRGGRQHLRRARQAAIGRKRGAHPAAHISARGKAGFRSSHYRAPPCSLKRHCRKSSRRFWLTWKAARESGQDNISGGFTRHALQMRLCMTASASN